MSAIHWMATIFEGLMIIAVMLGFIYEPMLAKWEEKQKEKVLAALKERKEYRR